MVEKIVTILNSLGIHARPSSAVVSIAEKYNDSIKLYFGNSIADAKSILDIMLLAMCKGAVVRVVVEGDNEKDAINDICNALVNIYDY